MVAAYDTIIIIVTIEQAGSQPTECLESPPSQPVDGCQSRRKIHAANIHRSKE